MAARLAAIMGGGDDSQPDEPDEPDAPPRAPPEGDDDEAANDEEGEGTDDAAGNEAPQSLDEVAKRMGMTRQEFNAIPVQVGGDTLTLGELKAKLPDLVRLDKDREALDDARGNWELERVASYRNINAILETLPRGAINPSVLREIEQQHDATRNRELQSLHFARPKWSDPTYSQGAKEKIFSVAAQYGFTKAEILGLMDHRFILWAQDDAELREKVRQSRDAARKVNEPGQGRPTGQGAARSAAESTTRPRSAKPTQEQRLQQLGAIMRRR